MKRDADLIREILFQVEASSGFAGFMELNIEGYDPELVAYHVLLLYEAGLIEAVDLSTFGSKDWRPVRLTWHGHEFLEAARDEARWGKVKKVMTKTGGLVISVAEQLLLELVKGQALKYLP